jgi:hypothetical protein
MRIVERVSVSAFVDPDDHERLVDRALSEDRSVSAELRLAIREHLSIPSAAERRALKARESSADRGEPMTLMGKIGALSPKTLLEQGELDEVLQKKRRAYDAAVRPARLKIARGNRKWSEIENDLVPRNQGR